MTNALPSLLEDSYAARNTHMPAAPAIPLTPELIETVLDRMAAGESLRAICREPEMPERQQFMRLKRLDSTFADQYTRAREDQAEGFYEELLEIADDGSNDTYAITDESGKSIKRTDYDVIQRSKLRVDTRKWAMSKILAKTFGDKLDMNVAGANGGPIVFEVKRVDQE